MARETGELSSGTTEVSPGDASSQTVPLKEWTKKWLALGFVGVVLILIGVLPLILLFMHTVNVEGYKDIILTLGSILGGPLGIIISNYFKESGGS